MHDIEFIRMVFTDWYESSADNDKDKKRADKIATNIISKYHHIEE
jgi:hypothetical protein|tara:strand:- start:184 stop:318 length:135 start_codon:yes stop_codon:yes gene_type:complete